ncbi:MAG TPA: divalent-cation tolerance protein CutA [Candidatus Paceibacterota bacterium]|nr:divalent-cation tolerance protein CutA [Candidatus Paceibacterota bacterium]
MTIDAMKYKFEFIKIYTTVAKKSDAERIAKILSEKKLSACTQIAGPITSVYKWKGKLEKSKEWMCSAKARKGDYKKIEKAIKEIHPYKLPEIIALPIVGGSPEYFNWMRKEI